MTLPFPLSDADAQQFVNVVGYDNLNGLPQWGGIINWAGRYVLVYPKYDGTFAFTDITAGIPDSGVPSGVIPVSSLIANTPVTQTSTFGVFLYSLPSNFYNVAKEDAKKLFGDLADAAKPLLPTISLTAIIVIGVLVMMYIPRRN